MRGLTTSKLFFALLLFKEFLVGRAKTQHVSRRRGLKGSPIQRALQDELPCTELFSTRKSKFDKFDDDWYSPCKTVESGRPTAPPTPREAKTRSPSAFFSTTPPVSAVLSESGPPLSMAIDQVSSILDQPIKSVIEPTDEFTSIFPDNDAPRVPPSEAPIESEETSVEVEIDVDVPIIEKGSSCLKAKAGKIFPTSVNFTIHYKYELLAKRDSNLTDVVWPEVDRAFQRFLALTLIDCDIDVTKSGASRTFKSRLKSISPEPIDSVGSLYPNGWNQSISANSTNSTANSCSKILIDDELLAKRGLYCDVVTGSITLFLSEVSYMDTASDPSILFLEYRDQVFQFLRDEINDGGEAISNYFDESLGIRGFHFLSESANLNLRPIAAIPDAASNEMNPFGSNVEVPTTTVIAGSLTALVAFTLAAGIFAIHRKRRHLHELDSAFKQSRRTPRMDDNEMEFYDLDHSNHGSPGDVRHDRSNIVCAETFCARQGNDLNESHDSDDGDDMQTTPRSDIDGNYDLNERSSQLSASYDYSQTGVSMHLHSPDKNLSLYSSVQRPDPSIVTRSYSMRRKLNRNVDEEYQRDDPSAPIRKSTAFRSKSMASRSTSDQKSTVSRSKSTVSRATSERKSIGSRSTSESSDSSSKYVDSVKGSPALEYILALGSTYLGSPSDKPFDEESATGNRDDVESKGEEGSSAQEPTHSPRAKSSPSSQIGKRSANKKHPVNIRNSPNSVTDYNTMQTPPPLASLDDGSSIQSPMSVASECSNNSRVEYLRNRRKDLENRFQNYRRSLSESMDNLSNPPSKPWLASREYSRSMSIYKNTDESFLSPVEGTKSKNSDEKRALVDADSMALAETKSPKVDFEEILDNDDAWGIEPPEEDDERYTIDNFLSSSSPKIRLESDPTRFQANTVIL